MKVAVLGAGPAGLIAMRVLQKRGPPNLEMVCFERAKQPGGEWIYTETIGKDEYGLPIHGSTYKGMRANLTKELMLLHPDFPWPKKGIDFPYREEVLNHIRSFANQFNLTKYVKFLHYVKSVSRVSPDSNQLKVEVRDLKADRVFSEKFDYVVMGTGKHGRAFIPHDTSSFSGEVMHYHDLKDHDRLKGKRVVIIGGGFGAMDMILHLIDIAESLILSYHQKPPFFGPQPGITYRPQIIKFSGKEVFFEDGSSCECDALLYATGFRQVQPLSPELDLNWNMGRFFFPLYKHIVHPNCPSLLFVGKSVSATILMCRVQAEFACQVINGAIKLPSCKKMNEEIAEFHARWLEKIKTPVNYDNFLPKVELEFENCKDVVKMAGCEPIPDYVRKLYYNLIKHIQSDLMNYQNYRLNIINKGEDDCTFEWIPPEVRRVIKPAKAG